MSELGENPAGAAPAATPAPDTGAVTPDVPTPPAPAPAPATPPVGQTADAAASGGEAVAKTTTPKPPTGVTLDGKDDTGAGDGNADGGKGEGEPPDGEAGKPPEGEYVIKHPDGFQPLPGAEAKLIEYGKAKGLDQAQVQELADLHSGAIQEMKLHLLQNLENDKAAWKAELAADPEFGGANLTKTGVDANRALKHFAPELIDKLPEWNLEQHPALIRAFARVGRTLRENSSPRGDNPNQYRKRSLADDKAEMLAAEEAKARG